VEVPTTYGTACEPMFAKQSQMYQYVLQRQHSWKRAKSETLPKNIDLAACGRELLIQTIGMVVVPKGIIATTNQQRSFIAPSEGNILAFYSTIHSKRKWHQGCETTFLLLRLFAAYIIAPFSNQNTLAARGFRYLIGVNLPLRCAQPENELYTASRISFPHKRKCSPTDPHQEWINSPGVNSSPTPNAAAWVPGCVTKILQDLVI